MGYKCWNSKSIPRLIASQHFLPPSLMCNGASVFSWEQSCFSPQYLIHQHPIIQVIQVNTSNTRNASNESYACNTSNISNTSNSGQAGPKPMKAHLFHLSLSLIATCLPSQYWLFNRQREPSETVATKQHILPINWRWPYMYTPGWHRVREPTNGVHR